MTAARDNVAIGRRAKSAGDAFEAWIEREHEEAGRLGILAHVVHNQARSSVVRGRLMFTSAGVADYTGTLEGGRTLAVEAKSTGETSLRRSAVEPLQATHLEAVARAGGLALLLVEFRSQSSSSRYAVPWLEVPWEVRCTAESVSREVLGPWLAQEREGSCYLSRFHPGGQPSWPGGWRSGRGLGRRRAKPTE